MFKSVDPKINFSELEEHVLEIWHTEKTFQRLQELRAGAEPFVFFEGPPTANGQPGIHHVEARAFKDLIPRYQTMRGKKVDRKAGWDTHGLPVELQVEKKLGLKNKKEIEDYGIAKFNQECRKDVWSYKEAWEKLTRRIGFWLDLQHPYITYENRYIESVWHILKTVADRKDPLGQSLLYQGHKVVPYCTRCGTALSSHEVAQGYKAVTDTSVFVKFRLTDQSIDLLKQKVPSSQFLLSSYLLAWTTTPWTLPGNVALAVGAKVEYTIAKSKDTPETYIIAKERYEALAAIAHLEPTNLAFSGSELVGIQYEPLFPGVIQDNGKAFRVYEADFVTTEEGTGIVHTAVMYGEDDYTLGVRVGLPAEHTVGEDGKFLPRVSEGLADRYVKDPETENIILDSLKSRRLVLVVEQHTHDYPFCWRCDTPLLYYARTSWFIRMSAFRDELVKRNSAVHWEPDSIKLGRMGEWLENVKDWAISRERYWGTPLPFWRCEHGHVTVVESVRDLASRQKSKNIFLILRHGETSGNVHHTLSSWPEKTELHLTDVGKSQVKRVASDLKNHTIDLIVASDLMRTKETAEAVAEVTGAPVQFDPRLREIDFGELNGAKAEEYIQLMHHQGVEDGMNIQIGGAESIAQVRKRMVEVVKELNQTHSGKTIVIVSHGDPLWILESTYRGWSEEELYHGLARTPDAGIDPGEARVLPIGDLPFDEEGVLNLHRPYIDDVTIACQQCGELAQRVPEVADVWLDSGAMPFAQWGYPEVEESEKELANHYPADYISEAIDQTRGWFYTLLAVATLMEREAPYKNVICLGHVLDDKGKKMSKSRGNIVDPWELINKYGADALRFYFYSVNAPGEPKLFTEKDVQTAQRRVMNLLWNIYSFFVTYANQASWTPDSAKHTTHSTQFSILDRWINARINQTTATVTESLDQYDVLQAARELQKFIDDLSTWYVRRSRSRFSDTGDEADRSAAFETLHACLVTLCRLMAPFAPFLSDEIHRNLVGTSVHLSDWPRVRKLDLHDENVLSDMEQIRERASSALEARMHAGIKVRQKLGELIIQGSHEWETPNYNLVNLLKDEVNVSNVTVVAHHLDLTESHYPDFLVAGTGLNTVWLDTMITPELEKEGMLRELTRGVQDWRKNNGLTVSDRVAIVWASDDSLAREMMQQQDLLATLASTVRATVSSDSGTIQLTEGLKLDLNGHSIVLQLKKVE